MAKTCLVFTFVEFYNSNRHHPENLYTLPYLLCRWKTVKSLSDQVPCDSVPGKCVCLFFLCLMVYLCVCVLWFGLLSFFLLLLNCNVTRNRTCYTDVPYLVGEWFETIWGEYGQTTHTEIFMLYSIVRCCLVLLFLYDLTVSIIQKTTFVYHDLKLLRAQKSKWLQTTQMFTQFTLSAAVFAYIFRFYMYVCSLPPKPSFSWWLCVYYFCTACRLIHSHTAHTLRKKQQKIKKMIKITENMWNKIISFGFCYVCVETPP